MRRELAPREGDLLGLPGPGPATGAALGRRVLSVNGHSAEWAELMLSDTVHPGAPAPPASGDLRWD